MIVGIGDADLGYGFVWKQRMVAVKKAYAETILNTAKEAAARVMAAERRALTFEHDLRATKDEALQMLLRLKQMIDSKVRSSQILVSLMDPIISFI